MEYCSQEFKAQQDLRENLELMAQTDWMEHLALMAQME
jgi:hypothetical protein